MRLLFDIESDELLDKATKIHCIVALDLDSGTLHSFTPDRIKDGVELLRKATLLVGHNILTFDVPMVEKLYGVALACEIRDTLVMSRLIWPDIRDTDFQTYGKDKAFPKELIGRHSLKAWGWRLGVHKGDFNTGDTSVFKEWSPEMQVYCERDVALTKTLWDRIIKKQYSEEAIKLEHQFARIINRMELNGFGFDKTGSDRLVLKLLQRRAELELDLQRVFPPTQIQMKRKVKEIPFNPGSRTQIADRLQERYGWKPLEFTGDGRPKIDESVLSKMEYPEAKMLLEFLLVVKRLGQVAEGDQAWTKLEKGGRIHGRVNTNGAVTGRCTHNAPNMAQVPAVGSSYGAECRSLFTPRRGWKLVGADASGLELRCLAHYMARWDDGAYATELIDGDIHTRNMKAAGLENRNQAKTFIYGFLYGAGDEKIGLIVGKGREEGARLKKRFLQQVPALKLLKDAVADAVRKRGHLKGLDGRLLPVRSPHSALNTLLQSAGALIMKRATVILEYDLEERGLKFGKDWGLCAHVHDEVQIECRPEIASTVGEVAVQSICKAGYSFGFRCPLAGEFRVGNNWAETH